MPDIKHLKNKLNATNNIKKITNALEIISTIKLQKAKKGTIQVRNCLVELIHILVKVDEKHELFSSSHLPAKTDKSLLVVVGTEKGLCGSLNSTLFKKINNHFGKHKEKLDVIVIGKKTKEYFSRRKYNIIEEIFFGDEVSLDMCQPLIKTLRANRQDGTYKHVYLCYNVFYNTMKYIPIIFPLYPLHGHDLKEFLHTLKQENIQTHTHSSVSHKTKTHHISELRVEPSFEEVQKTFYNLIATYVVYGAVLQNKTCEFAARMLAMKGAKDNASNQIEGLQLTYNKARQDNITKEIIEIAGAKSIITG